MKLRAAGPKAQPKIELGKSEMLREGADAVIVALGSMVWYGLEAASILEKQGIKAAVVNARFVKPLDEGLFMCLADKTRLFVTLEEGVIEGGFGSAVMEFFERERVNNVKIVRIGLPSEFMEHGSKEELFKKYNITPEGIAAIINQARMQR